MVAASGAKEPDVRGLPREWLLRWPPNPSTRGADGVQLPRAPHLLAADVASPTDVQDRCNIRRVAREILPDSSIVARFQLPRRPSWVLVTHLLSSLYRRRPARLSGRRIQEAKSSRAFATSLERRRCRSRLREALRLGIVIRVTEDRPKFCRCQRAGRVR